MTITAPTASSISITNLTNAGAASLDLTPSAASRIFWYVLPSSSAAPTIDTVINPAGSQTTQLIYGNSSVAGSAVSVILSPTASPTLATGTAYTVYYVLFSDTNNSVSTLLSQTFTTLGSLTYSATTFVEAVANNGSITETRTITLVGDTYTGTDTDVYVSGTKYTAAGVPSGLTLVVTKTSDTILTLSFTGTAAAHAVANNTTFTLTLLNAAFTNGSAARFINVKDFTITFTAAA
jgi:hypothetical protein